MAQHMKIGFAGASHLKRYTGTRSTHENSISRNVTSQRVSGGEGVQHMEIAFSRSVVSQKGNGGGSTRQNIISITSHNTHNGGEGGEDYNLKNLKYCKQIPIVTQIITTSHSQ